MRSWFQSSALILILAGVAFADAPLRTWELDSGEQIRGKLIAYEQSAAQVELEDGSVRLIPAKELSSRDRAHIHAQRRLARREQEDAELSDRLSDPLVVERMAAAQRRRLALANRPVVVSPAPAAYSWPVRWDLYYYYNGLGIAPFSYVSPAGYYGGWYRPCYIYGGPRYYSVARPLPYRRHAQPVHRGGQFQRGRR